MRYVVAFIMFFVPISVFVSGCSTTPQKSREELAAENLEKAKLFLLENKSNPNIKETFSGLQYKVLKAGNGKRANRYSDVYVHFEGRLLGDVRPFDASDKNKPPVKVPLPAVIEGWREGISLMNEGSTYMFFIPPQLAYGEKGSNPTKAKAVVGPNELLIYTITLVKVGSK